MNRSDIKPRVARKADVHGVSLLESTDRPKAGLGAQMLRALERSARSRGVCVLTARTTIGQMAARRLYSGHGHREIGSRREGAFEVLTFEKR